MHPDITYRNLVDRIQKEGNFRGDRTGTGTQSLFGPQMEFNLINGFPLLTTKKINFDDIWTELRWFLKGDTNIKFLKENGCNIWNRWANEDGDLGPVYGAMWRNWPALVEDADGNMTKANPVDQVNELVANLRKNPYSRRHIITGWNPALLPDESLPHEENIANGKQVLPPCHTMFQFYVHDLTLLERVRYAQRQLGDENANLLMKFEPEDAKAALDDFGVPTQGLQCKLYQRSADMFLGVPYNIASYALLTCLIAEMLDMAATKFIHTFGDAHIYSNHAEQFETQFSRIPKHQPFLLVSHRVRGYESVDQIEAEDVDLIGYSCHPFIKAPVAV